MLFCVAWWCTLYDDTTAWELVEDGLLKGFLRVLSA